MDDRERADKLAKAIEEMVQGRVPEDVDDEELKELLKIARIRLDAARIGAEASEEGRDEVFQRLLARLSLRHPGEEGDWPEPEDGAPTAENIARGMEPGEGDPEQGDVRQLQAVIGLRREAAEQAVAVAERYGNAVWQRVEARILAQRSDKRSLIRWPFRRRDRRPEELGAALDRMILGEPIWEAPDSKLAQLVHVARLRRAAAVTAGGGFVDQQERVWARIRPRLIVNVRAARTPQVFERRAAAPWPKLAAAGAVMAVVIAGLGPIPATGFAQHPAAQFYRFVAGQVTVSETSSPPPQAPVSEVLAPEDVTLQEAQVLLGLAAFEPSYLPEGYQKVSARFYEKGITSAEGGVFVLTYESTEGDPNTVIVYQEHASSTSIAVAKGFAQDIPLLPDLTAVYVDGSWSAVGSATTWSGEGGQTIVFDQNGLRTIVLAPEDSPSETELRLMAEGLAEQTAQQ
jgi:hypothetical protein